MSLLNYNSDSLIKIFLKDSQEKIDEIPMSPKILIFISFRLKVKATCPKKENYAFHGVKGKNQKKG